MGEFPQVTLVPLVEGGVEKTYNELSNAVHAFLRHDEARTNARIGTARYTFWLDEIPQKLRHKIALILR